jgi:hypothetical protein
MDGSHSNVRQMDIGLRMKSSSIPLPPFAISFTLDLLVHAVPNIGIG